MECFLIPLRPLVLAVIVGLVDLFLNEVTKTVFKLTDRWRNRMKLYSERTYEIRPRSSVILSVHSILLIIQVVLLSVGIALELSISPESFPSTVKVEQKCFKPRRETRAIQKRGPSTTELNDERVLPYLSVSNCLDGLVQQVIVGPTALYKGYPNCSVRARNQQLNTTLRLQGSAVAFVANSRRGDPHLAYGVEKAGYIIGEDTGYRNGTAKLAPRSFFSLLPIDSIGSTAFWSFPRSPQMRIVSNMALPRVVLKDFPRQFNSLNMGTINCSENNIQCYHHYAKIAHGLPNPIFRAYSNHDGALLISSHRFLPSFVCFFDKVQIKTWWVFMNQFIPDVERNGRSGPLPTRINIGGQGKCAFNISRESARLYIDAMERISLKQALDQLESENQESNTFKLFKIVQMASVIMGMVTPRDQNVNCSISDVVHGSSIGRREVYIASTITFFLLLAIICCIFYVIWTIRNCPLHYNPIDMKTILRMLHDQRCRETTFGSGSRAIVHLHFLDDGTVHEDEEPRSRVRQVAMNGSSSSHGTRNGSLEEARSNKSNREEKIRLRSLRTLPRLAPTVLRPSKYGDEALLDFQHLADGYHLNISLPFISNQAEQ